MQAHAAILTGDLIRSTRGPKDQTDAAMQVLAKIAQDIDDDTRFTRFRGDGWQIYLHNAGNCLWACLLIAARLKASRIGLSTRISVGIGPVWHLPDRDLSAASGLAFMASGRGLDDMPPTRTFAINGESVDRIQQSIFAFAADRVSNWSFEQAEATAMALAHDMPSRAAIGTTLGITRQAVDARLAAAGYRLLEDAHLAFVERYTQSMQKVDP